MKKTVKNFIIGAVFAAGVFATSTAALAGTTKFVQTDMNFRMGPSAAATIIGSVPEGAKVEILNLIGEWDLIIFNGTVGYIHTGNTADTYVAKQVTPQAAPQTTAQAAQLAKQQSAAAQTYATAKAYFDNNWTQTAQGMQGSAAWKTVKVDAGYLAIRNAATYEDSNIIGQLNTGDSVQVIGYASGSYVEVYSPRLGVCGWVNAGFLR